MTMPHLMNCPHSEDGWCLDCVKELWENSVSPKGLDWKEILQKSNNPKNNPVGHFSGRCSECHSNNLWDDATAYGCNCCGALFMTDNIVPKMVNNETGEVIEFNNFEEFKAFHEQWTLKG